MAVGGEVVGLDGSGGGRYACGAQCHRPEGGPGEHLCDVKGGLSRGEGPVVLLVLLDLLTLSRVV